MRLKKVKISLAVLACISFLLAIMIQIFPAKVDDVYGVEISHFSFDTATWENEPSSTYFDYGTKG